MKAEGSDSIVGGCHCGAVRYRCAGEPEGVFFCHCLDCQRTSGSAFSMEVMVQRDAFDVEGELTRYEITTETGDQVTRCHCPTCGSGIYLDAKSDPVHLFVKVGSLDDPGAVTPQMHIFTKYRQSWLEINDGLPQFSEFPGE